MRELSEILRLTLGGGLILVGCFTTVWSVWLFFKGVRPMLKDPDEEERAAGKMGVGVVVMITLMGVIITVLGVALL